jgi:hypothetical protein
MKRIRFVAWQVSPYCSECATDRKPQLLDYVLSRTEFTVMVDDDFVCGYCGRTAAEIPEAPEPA